MSFVVDSQSKFVRVSLTMSDTRSICKRKVVEHATTEYLPPDDIEEFCTEILDAGARLADLVVVEYPNARLVNNTLFAVTEVVEFYGLKGRWVTSWASSARNEFLATNGVREVSICVAVLCVICKVRVAHVYFVIDYISGSNRLHEEVVLLP